MIVSIHDIDLIEYLGHLPSDLNYILTSKPNSCHLWIYA